MRSPDTGLAQYVTLAGHQVCVTVDGSRSFLHGGVAACDTVDRLDAYDQILVVGAGGSTSPLVLAGLVPDGVTRVSLSAGSTTTMIPVIDNAFHVDPAPPGRATIAWVGTDGARHSEEV